MRSKNKFFVIVNPKAGGGLGRRHWSQISGEFEKRLGSFHCEETATRGHARLLAEKAAKTGFLTVVACGGDGTIHEVVNGLVDSGVSPRPVLGILSAGTGGDTIRTLGIPKDGPSQVRIIEERKLRPIDLGHVEYSNSAGEKEGRVFINIADAGLGADVIKRTRNFQRIFGRKLTYLTSTLYSYLAWNPKAIHVSIGTGDRPPNSWPKDPMCVIVANGRYFGGGMPIAPAASPDDGLMDLIVMERPRLLMAPLAIPMLYLRQFPKFPGVHTSRVKGVTLDSPHTIELDMDGELIGSLPATFKILPKSLSVIVP